MRMPPRYEAFRMMERHVVEEDLELVAAKLGICLCGVHPAGTEPTQCSRCQTIERLSK